MRTAHSPRVTEISGSAEPVIEVSGLTKSYADRLVVDGVDFVVDSGEIFGVLGANGAGKTTAIECLQGLRRPDGGCVRVLGLDPSTDRSRLRPLIGSQLQEAALPDRLQVGEAVALFDRGRPRTDRDLLEEWGLAAMRRTEFGDLSGGQRQRLFIVLALLNTPQVVFLDELTQGLDPAARRDIWDVIRRVRAEGATVMVVSHFADEIEALCDRVVVMANGRIVDRGTPQELTDRHARTTTVTFTPPVNLMPDTVRRVPGVDDVTRLGARLVVTGNSSMVGPVCSISLGQDGCGPGDLRVVYPNLDDALVSMIGAR